MNKMRYCLSRMSHYSLSFSSVRNTKIAHFQSDANPIKKISSLTGIWLLSRYIITKFARL